MKKIYIRFITTGKIFSFEGLRSDQKVIKLKPGQSVLAESEGIIEEGVVVEKPENSSDSEEAKGVILRLTSPEDRQQFGRLKESARQYIGEAQAKVIRHNLKMKILDVDLSFDQKKLTFYFQAKGRVDFRSLVIDMAKSFDKLIRLQQVGAREEAKHFSGIGKCGRELCCAKFLNNLEAINLEIVQSQEWVAANPSKSVGCCGKLMCCLAFEAENHSLRRKDIVKRTVSKAKAEANDKPLAKKIKDKIKKY